MRGVILLVSAGLALVVAPTTAVATLYRASVKEIFECAGTTDADDIADWSMFGGSSRFFINSIRPYAGAKNAYVVNGGNGQSYSLVPDIQAVSSTFSTPQAIDWHSFAIQFCMRHKGSAADRRHASFFVERSMGDVYAPNDWAYSGLTLPVLAYGWTGGIRNSKITPLFFGGATWIDFGNPDAMANWNVFVMRIYGSTVNFNNASNASGS